MARKFRTLNGTCSICKGKFPVADLYLSEIRDGIHINYAFVCKGCGRESD
jgi:hypothetical protein